ncbi:atlastin-like [Ostrinia furnacalis]|uniref:atlastin-like n=1 Tax=Ostrinia furnacalis TaxID=93504 RepID=UPI00103F1A5D|nr:atlastin-like [Ostrinia furnacalis]
MESEDEAEITRNPQLLRRSMVDLGRSLQVVDVNSDRSFALDEAALRALLTPELRALPVAVLSVAGAFRGGKSFLLDFFLRYLNASVSAHRRTMVRWRGALSSFINNIIIHNWWNIPRCISATLSAIKLHVAGQVAVVLMDTQGTFDNESTIGECTTIFALSTLLSSVQIYNIKGDLGGDNLQHLQYFTAIARLVQDNDAGYPFQHLKFLIRDWTSDVVNYPHGAEGGRRLIERVLQVRPEQPPQLQELRRDLRSCFENIDCFLMAHPGYNVGRQGFQGCLADLQPEFRTCLLELVPLVLAPNRLVVKRIGGQKVTADEFIHYFKNYMDLFNSGNLPEPATILQAAAETGLLLATEAARAEFANHMEKCAGARPMAPAAVRRIHAQAVAAARELFTARRLMGNRQNIDQALARITTEFEGRLQDFITINEANMGKAYNEAVSQYVELVLGTTAETRLCVGPAALEDAHSAAYDTVVQGFKDMFEVTSSDNETKQLIRDINARYASLVQINEMNNSGHLSGAVNEYVSEMNRQTEGQPCMSTSLLNVKHASALQAAMDFFKSKRNHSSDPSHSDSYLERLERDIVNNQLVNYVRLNKANTAAVVMAVVSNYKDRMAQVFGMHMKCVPPRMFVEKERDVRVQTRKMYQEKIEVAEGEPDSHWVEIERTIDQHCAQVKENNVELNIGAVNAAIEQYRKLMDNKTEPYPALLRWLLSPARLIQLSLDLRRYHQASKTEAIAVFKARRRDELIEPNDVYYEDLKAKIIELHKRYKNPLQIMANELSNPAMLGHGVMLGLNNDDSDD